MARNAIACWMGIALLGVSGCSLLRSPLPPGYGITTPPTIPLPAAMTPALVPLPSETKSETVAVPDPATTALTLEEVLLTLEQNFPLINAVEQERAIAAGLRLSAEGQFDLTLRSRGGYRDGTFANGTFDTVLEQPTPFRGITTFAGYRFGLGNFPVYSGGLKTASLGEFRAGILVPLLKDGPIDRRRVLLRQTQLGEALADPAVRRVRIDAHRAARRAYTNWLAAGEQASIAARFVEIAVQREDRLRKRFTAGQISPFEPEQARQALADRQGRQALAAQRFQQAILDLSLLYRDGSGRPLLASATRLPTSITTIPLPEFAPDDVPSQIQSAIQLRPELMRFPFLKERAGLELEWAKNQTQPGVNLGLAASQDAGPAKKTVPTGGLFTTDVTGAEAFVTVDLPVQRRAARGTIVVAQAQMIQLLQNEKYLREAVAAEVQTFATVLVRDRQRIEQAKIEVDAAGRVADIARSQYEGGAIPLFQLNVLEGAALDVQAKYVEVLADYFRALADYRAALGQD